MAGPVGQIVSAPGAHELFSLLNVLVVVAVVVVFARRGIQEIFKSRSQKLRDELIATREDLKKISQEIELSRSYLANIEKEKNELIRKVEEEGKLLASRLVDEAKASADRIKEDSDRAASAEFAEMRKRLKAELLDSLVAKVHAEFSSENSQQKLHERLIDGFLNQSESLSKKVSVTSSGGQA
jgi:F0F1-type ATP synthase membrane subunit b/b'